MKRALHKFNTDEVARLRMLAGQAMDSGQIADAMGLHRKQVQYIARKFGVTILRKNWGTMRDYVRAPTFKFRQAATHR